MRSSILIAALCVATTTVAGSGGPRRVRGGRMQIPVIEGDLEPRAALGQPGTARMTLDEAAALE